MSIKRKIALAVLSLSCLSAAVIAGCKIGDVPGPEFLENNQATNQCVTYFGNGGIFNSNELRTKLDINYKADSYIMLENVRNFTVSRTDYIFDGWYYAQVDGEGNLLTDEDGNALIGDRVEEKRRISANTHLYLVAGWYSDAAIDVYLVTDDDFELRATVSDGDGDETVTYRNGDLISTKNFGVFTSYELNESEAIANPQNATYLAFFEDEECTVPITRGIPKPQNTTENIKVYVKYLPGSWSIVRNASDVYSMFNTGIGRSNNYYLFTTNANNVIDCSTERNISVRRNADNQFNATVEGNGIVITNLSYSATGLINNSNCSIFGTLTDNSKVRNLTLRNVNVNLTVIPNATINIFAVCSAASSGAQLENFNIENLTVTVTMGENVIIDNIPEVDSEYETTHWLFGGNGDDEALTPNGLTIDGKSLFINDEQIV